MTNREDALLSQDALLKIAVLLIVGAAVLSLKAWLLVLVLGWFGITAIGFWKAVVAVLLLDLLVGACRSK